MFENAKSVTEEDFNLQILEIFPNSPEVYDHFIEKGNCPNCMSRLELKNNGRELSEYQGRIVGEQLSILVCSNCGFEYDNNNAD